MSQTPTEKETLEQRIKKVEGDLYRAKKERDSWGKGKYRSPGQVRMLATFVDAAEKDLAKMREELRQLEGKGA